MLGGDLTKREALCLGLLGGGLAVYLSQKLNRDGSGKQSRPRWVRNSNQSRTPRSTAVAAHVAPGFDRGDLPDDIVALPPADQIEVLQARNKQLQRLLTLTEATALDVEEKLGEDHLTPSDIETLRAFFDCFDHNENGCVWHDDFVGLHTKLGEPITKEEAKAILKELDPDNVGEVSFERFLWWWHQTHKANKQRSVYTSKFKMLSAKLGVSEFDPSKLIVNKVGREGTTEYRFTFHMVQPNKRLKQISPWHDIPLYHVGHVGHSKGAKLFNFVCEIPKWTRAKYEIATNEAFNPIKHDVKNGKVRYYKHGDFMFNYGAFPQTYEDPNHVSPDTGMPGDCDPVDVVDIGTVQLRTGSVTPVKILAILALIDSGETDWKVIVININDPLAHKLHDAHDIERVMPGAVGAIREYFRVYKVCTGSQENNFALRGEARSQEYATRVVEECHEQWRKLREAGGAEPEE